MRALHQSLDDEPKILVDPIAPKLVDVAGPEAAWLAPMLRHTFAPQWRAGFAVRSRYVEDCLAAAVARGLGQYLILGAGLDTFAYRQPDWAKPLAIFEIDHPATQAMKCNRIARAGIVPPSNLVFVPVDFEVTSLRQALGATSFVFDRPVFCSWLGVMQYLTDEAIDATLAFMQSLPRGSEIAFSFMLPDGTVPGIEGEALAIGAARTASVGEPWLSRFHPADLAARLRRMGFSEVVHLTPEQVQERYFKGRRDGLTARRGEQLMRAVT